MKEKTIRLLLVEDDKVDQMAFERLVKNENLPYDYTIVCSVADGKEVLQTESFDVIIMDYWLGDGTSFELFELFKDHPVIVTTGTGNEEVAVEAMKLGACDYLIKDPEGNYLKTLSMTVELALKRKENERELNTYHERLEAMVEERTAELQAEIVERKKAEAAIRKSEEQWYRTFNSFTDIVTLLDANLRIVKFNQAACTTLGLSSEKIIGLHCYELFDCTDGPCRNCPTLQTRKIFKPYNREMYHEKLKKTFLVSASPVFDDQGKLEYIAHVAKDITEMKQLETKLLQSQKMEAIGTLAGGIAHDFNNILSAIIGYAELIQQEAQPGSRIEEDILEVLKAGGRAADLVKHILTVSRQTKTEKQPIRPHLIVKEAMELLHATIPTSITIEEDIDSDCGIIWADATNIHQIAVNLCTNGLHALADEKGTLQVSLKRKNVTAAEVKGEESLAPGPFVVFTVRDTGCGMDMATRDRIFEPYFTTKEVGKGTGLGLAVIQAIVHDANGFVRVESTPGEGSTFAVYIPALKEKIETDAEITMRDPYQGGNEHILIVDDENLLVRVTQRQLETLGYKVTATTESREALAMIRTSPDQFDLLITDQTMPGLTGLELAMTAKEIREDLPVIICTGHSETTSRAQALEAGVNEYISKPILGDELFKAVRLALDEKNEA